jgi:hypothetical protein
MINSKIGCFVLMLNLSKRMLFSPRWLSRCVVILIILLVPAVTIAAKAKDASIDARQIDRSIKYFAQLGMHRCGTNIDTKTKNWIKKRFEKYGLEVSEEPFTFRRPISRTAMISMKVDRINSRILPGMPLLNAVPTGERSISGQLGFLGQYGKIPVIHLYVTATSGTTQVRAKSLRQFKAALASGRYRAVVGITQGGYSGLVPLNIDLSRRYKTPAMLLSSTIGNYAEIYAEINNPIRFKTQIAYEESTGYNIIGKVLGSDSQAKPIVIIVPRSAWWYAAAERGTSVAAMLAAAKVLAKQPLKHTLYFVSTTGQEFYSLGLRKFLSAHPDLVKNAYAWIYLGANVGTNPKPDYIVQGSSRRMRRLVHRIFDEHDIKQVRWLHQPKAILSPLRKPFLHSDHAVIIAATNNRCDRMTCDKWPSAVNVKATLAFTQSLIQMLHYLSK